MVCAGRTITEALLFMPPDEAARVARIERVVASYELLMRRIAAFHAPELLEVAVTMSQAKVLYLVAAAQGMRMSELAARLGVSISTTSGLVDRLVDHGLLDRRDDPADRRQVVVTITPTGRADLERFRELNAAQLRRVLERLGDAELDLVERATFLLAVAADAPSPGVAPAAAPDPSQDFPAPGDQP
jgi:DNA-binding MarR family transcriptional regulator